MVFLNHGETKAVAGAARNGLRAKLARVRLAREIFDGRYLPGESVQLSEIAAKYQLDGDSVLTILAELSFRKARGSQRLRNRELVRIAVCDLVVLTEHRSNRTGDEDDTTQFDLLQR